MRPPSNVLVTLRIVAPLQHAHAGESFGRSELVPSSIQYSPSDFRVCHIVASGGQLHTCLQHGGSPKVRVGKHFSNVAVWRWVSKVPSQIMYRPTRPLYCVRVSRRPCLCQITSVRLKQARHQPLVSAISCVGQLTCHLAALYLLLRDVFLWRCRHALLGRLLLAAVRCC
jgi:hypothetical protein